MTARDLTTLFVGLWLVGQTHPATEAEAAWLAFDDRGAAVWEAGRAVGLVGPWERSWVVTPPVRGGAGRVADYRTDLNRLRERAHPKPPPCPPGGGQ